MYLKTIILAEISLLCGKKADEIYKNKHLINCCDFCLKQFRS